MKFSPKEQRDKLGKQLLARYYDANMALLHSNNIEPKTLPQNLLNVLLLNHPDMLKKKIDILAKYNFFKGSMQTTEVFQLINEALNKRNGEFVNALATIKKNALKVGATTKQADALVEKFSSVVSEQDSTIKALANQAVKAMQTSKKLGLHYAEFANKSRVVVTSVDAKTIQDIYEALGKNFFTSIEKNKSIVDKKAIVSIMDKCSGLVTNCSTRKIEDVATILKRYELELKTSDVTLDVKKVITRCPSILCSSNDAGEINEIIEFLLGRTTQSDKLHIKLSPKQLVQLLEADASILTIKPENLYSNMREIRANLRPLLTVQQGDKTVTDTKQLTEIVSNLFVGKNRTFIRNMDVNYTSQNDAILKKHIGENVLAVYKYCPMLLTVKPAVLNNVMETLSTYPNGEQLKRLLVTTNMNASSSIAVNNFLYKLSAKDKKIDEVERVSTGRTSKGAFQNSRIHYNDTYTPVESKTRIATTLYKRDRILATSMINMIREIAEIDTLAHSKTSDNDQFISFVNGKLDEYEPQMQALIDDNSYYDQYTTNVENIDILSQMNHVYTSMLKDPDSIYTDKDLMDSARMILGDNVYESKDTFEQLKKLNADQKELITKHCNPGIVKLRNREDDLRNDLVSMQMLSNMYQLLSNYVGPQANVDDLQQIITDKGLDADATKLINNRYNYIEFIGEHGTPSQKLAVRIAIDLQKTTNYIGVNGQEVDLGQATWLQTRVQNYADTIAQDFRKELNQNQK